MHSTLYTKQKSYKHFSENTQTKNYKEYIQWFALEFLSGAATIWITEDHNICLHRNPINSLLTWIIRDVLLSPISALFKLQTSAKYIILL